MESQTTRLRKMEGIPLAARTLYLPPAASSLVANDDRHLGVPRGRVVGVRGRRENASQQIKGLDVVREVTIAFPTVAKPVGGCKTRGVLPGAVGEAGCRQSIR